VCVCERESVSGSAGGSHRDVGPAVCVCEGERDKERVCVALHASCDLDSGPAECVRERGNMCVCVGLQGAVIGILVLQCVCV